MKMITALVASVLLAACGSAPEPHALTENQAELLAVVRFTNYDDHLVAFHGGIPSAAGTLELAGRLDFVRSVGYATLRTDGVSGYGSAGVLQWTRNSLAFLEGAAQATDPPPSGQWQLRALQVPGGELDTALVLLLGLGNDRPDNAQLLRQSDARWLRSDTVDGRPVDVFEGPHAADRAATGAPRLRYWVGDDARLRRVEARIGTARDPATFDFTSGAAPFTVLPELSG
jgi:hypothetical protein